MTQRLRSPWLALAALALIGCSQGADPSPPSSSGARPRTMHVTMSVETSDVLALDEAVRALVEREGGYVVRASADDVRASLTLRVPADRLSAFRRAARRLGDVTGESQLIEDAGDRQGDLAARLRSARAEEARLVARTSDRTATPDESISLEERLATVRTRIDELEREHAAHEHRIEYADVQIDVARARVPFWTQPWETIASAGSAGWSVARAILVGAAAAIAVIGPTALMFALVLASLILGARFIARRKRAIAT